MLVTSGGEIDFHNVLRNTQVAHARTQTTPLNLCIVVCGGKSLTLIFKFFLKNPKIEGHIVSLEINMSYWSLSTVNHQRGP